jgi:hypothetical protein
MKKITMWDVVRPIGWSVICAMFFIVILHDLFVAVQEEFNFMMLLGVFTGALNLVGCVSNAVSASIHAFHYDQQEISQEEMGGSL